ncbi:MAG: hypothetical protein KatS3mg101_0975 [Patescibacteria group bacterium]|nr:MAG: hypothetical protein KatS3mg101_0975 [Patescibacteria group bacterium]
MVADIFILIPIAEDQIVGVEVQPIADRIVVYKTKSSYLVQLDTVSFGNYTLLDPQYAPISTAVGCSSQDTIAVVENDLFYFGRDGIYVTGYEPNFLNIIRTNEVSFRVKPYLDLLSQDDFDTACAVYFDKKYILSFPLRKEMLVYDRSRGCFVGIWRLPFGIRYMKKYVDIDGNEKLILGTDDGKVYNFNASINSDNGEIIEKRLKTNKTSFGDWTTMNTVGFFYFLFRNIVGTTNVTITLEDREGITSAIKTFTITGAEQAGKTGYGIDPYGTAEYGLSNYYDVSIASDEIMRWGTAFKTGKLMQVEVSSTESNSNFELLKIAVTAKKHSRGTLSSSLRV